MNIYTYDYLCMYTYVCVCARLIVCVDKEYCCTLMHRCIKGLHSLAQPSWRLQNWSKT